MGTNPLNILNSLGQSPWYDYITRDLITSGELARLIEQDGLRGMTTNPTIFEKAVSGGDVYDGDIRATRRRGQDAGPGVRGAGRGRRARRVRRLRPSASGPAGTRRTGVARGLTDPGTGHGGDHCGGRTALGADRAGERDDQDSGHQRRAARDHRVSGPGHQRERHPALLGRPLPRGDGRVHGRARAPGGAGSSD